MPEEINVDFQYLTQAAEILRKKFRHLPWSDARGKATEDREKQ
jgi:hypothetical protein